MTWLLKPLIKKGAALFAAAFWLCVVPVLGTAETRFTVEEGRKLAGVLLQSGRLPEAREMALGLLQADKKDVAALIIVSQAERGMGRPDVARDAGAAAWAYATTPAQRYAAAVVTAQALASSKNYSRSQLWMRRAAQHAPNAAVGQIVARDYGRLRQINPLSLSFGARVSPSSNVNNGSANRTTTFEGIPFVFTLSPEARALSGVEATVNAGLKYRLSANESSATHLTLDLFSRQIAFSSKAKAAAPGARASDYAFAQVSLGVVRSWAPKAKDGGWTAGLTFGQSTYGGNGYTRTGQIYLTRGWVLDETTKVSLTLGGEVTDYLTTGHRSDSVNAKAVWTKDLSTGRAVNLSLGLGDTKSSSATATFSELSVGAKYSFGEVLSGLDLTMSYQLEQQEYPVAGLIAGARSDLRHALTAEIGLNKVTFYGFEPVVSVEATKTQSNVDFYDSMAVKLGVNLRSSF